MFASFDPGALLARWYPLPGGTRVCLRLARTSDVSGIEALIQSRDVAPDILEVARLVRSDPRRRLVITATALVDTTEAIVGIGAIELERGSGEFEPLLLLVDERFAPGVGELLAGALAGRAQALARARAA